MMRKHHSQKNTNAGFTLVELIVVLVILAVLAAILIPALLGWIDKARRKQDVLEAKNCLTAAQAEFSSAYATRGEKENGQVSILSPAEVAHYEGRIEGNVSNADMYLYKGYANKTFTNADKTTVKLTEYSGFAEKILKTAGYDKEEDYPYYLIVGAGNYVKYYDSDPHKPYTICFAMYQKTKNSRPIFFDGNTWVEKYPRESLTNANDQKFNYYTIKGERIRVQYYILSNKETSGNWYDNLPANAKK